MSFGAAVDRYYQTRTGCPIHGIALSGKPSGMPKRRIPAEDYKRIIREVKTSDKRIHPELWNYTADHLHAGIDRIYGDIKPGHPDFENAVRMKYNAARFAAYKTAHQVHDIRQSKNPLAVNNRYNHQWMQTEYVHTVRSARMARKWRRFQEDKDIYPYLEYMPSTAAEPRNEHKRLYGVIKPVDDPFWDTWLPPNDWGCKCSVRQVDKPASFIEPPDDIKKPPAVMRNNPGKTGIIFTDGHPMIKRVSKTARLEIESEFEKLIFKKTKEEVYAWAEKHLAGKTIKAKDKPPFKLTKKKIKTVLSKPARNRWLRNLILKHITYYYEKSIFIHSAKESKGRNQYKYWYYYKVNILNHTYYLNIVMLSNGEKRLHAIQENIK